MSPLVRAFLVALFGVTLSPQSSCAAPLISEILYDAVGADNGYGFVELYGTPGGALSGLSLQGINGATGLAYVTLNLSGTFHANGAFVVADDSGDGTTKVPHADLILNFDLQNGPDSLLLKSGASILDAVGYGVFGAGTFFVGEGTPALATLPGQSLARHRADLDTDNNAADFSVQSVVTPGQVVTAPLPGTLGLLLAGTWVVIGVGRRGEC